MKGVMQMVDSDQSVFRTFAGLSFLALVVFAGSSSVVQAEGVTRSLNLAFESEVFLRRGDGVVTQLDLDARMADMPERMRGEFLASPDRLTDLVNNLVTTQQMYQAALADQPELVQDRLNQVRILQQIEQGISRQWLEMRWQQERLDDYTARARELYLASPALFREASRYDITVAWVEAGRDKSELDAMRKIIEIHDAAAEQDLADVSKRLSDRSGGEAEVSFERVDIDQLDETVGRMVQTLSPGQISDPFRAASGWYIVRLDAIHKGEVPLFDQIEDRARRVAERRHREASEERLLRALNAEPVTVAEGAVESLLSRYPHREDDRQQLLRDIQAGFQSE